MGKSHPSSLHPQGRLSQNVRRKCHKKGSPPPGTVENKTRRGPGYSQPDWDPRPGPGPGTRLILCCTGPPGCNLMSNPGLLLKTRPSTERWSFRFPFFFSVPASADELVRAFALFFNFSFFGLLFTFTKAFLLYTFMGGFFWGSCIVMCIMYYDGAVITIQSTLLWVGGLGALPQFCSL